MKITIDTKEDSHHEIEKAIRLLQSLISGKTAHSNIFEEDSQGLPASNSEPSSGGLFNMFGDNSTPPPTPPEIRPTPEPSEVKEKKDIPEVKEY